MVDPAPERCSGQLATGDREPQRSVGLRGRTDPGHLNVRVVEDPSRRVVEAQRRGATLDPLGNGGGRWVKVGGGRGGTRRGLVAFGAVPAARCEGRAGGEEGAGA